MAAPDTTPLPEAPLPNDSKTVFNEKAFPFVNALVQFQGEINELVAWLNLNINVQQPTVVATPSFDLPGTDSGAYIRMQYSGAKTLTVEPNVDEPQQDGAMFLIANRASGDLTIVEGAGVSINGNVVLENGASAFLQRVSSDTWDLIPLGGEFTADLTALEAEIGSKAPLNNPTFTGTVSGISKAMVGLGNADDTSDVDKPVSTAQAVAIAARALSTDLSSNNDNAKGAALIGYRGQSLREYLDSTVKANSFVPGRVRGAMTNNQWGVRQIPILGDSISHGANAPVITDDAWTGVFRKMANAEFGGSNYGFCGINSTINNAEGTYQDYHFVSTTGPWGASSGADDDTLINGFSFDSTLSGNILTIEVPAVHKFFSIWYVGVIGGGDYLVRINGADSTIETTDVVFPGGFYRGTPFSIVDNGYGMCTIELIAQSNDPVRIMGVSYFDDPAAFQVNNFSQSGRRIEYLGDQVIDNVVGGCELLIFALGHNDQAASGATQTLIRAKFDRIISNANANDCKVLFLDFCWDAAPTTFIRSELDRAQKLINKAEIIKFPDLFYNSGAIATGTYLIDTLEFLSDGSHPSVFGHRVIAEAVAKMLSYSVSSKKQAAINCNRWVPLEIASANGWKSGGGTSAWRREGNNVVLKLNLDGSLKTTNVIGNLPADVTTDIIFYAPFYDSAGELFKIAIGAGSGSSINFATSATITWPITATIIIPVANIGEFQD